MPDPMPQVLRPVDAEAIRLARTLLRTARYGALAVLDPATGAPLASRVALATDISGEPLILVSALAAHTGALESDPRCSLMVGEPGSGDPLAHPRLTVSCRAERLIRGTAPCARAERRYLARQPKAALYAGFGDFSFFRLLPQGASLNGGFGRAYALTRGDLIAPAPSEGFAAAEPSAVAHMNGEHRDAIAVYARAFAGRDDGDWRLTGIDAEGVDLALGDAAARVWFDAPLETPSQMRSALVALASAGRARLTEPGSGN